MRFRPRHGLVCVLSLATLLGGCSTAYRSFYRETDHQLKPAPVAAEKVKVVKSVDHLLTPWTEVGLYSGHAPTVKEAMEPAKEACGKAGADFFILETDPYESRGVWKVKGICGARDEASADADADE